MHRFFYICCSNMSTYFYIDAQQRQCGPIPPTQFAAYGITPTTYVWTAGMAQWQQAGTIIELQPFFSQSQLFNAVGIRPSRPDNNLVWAILSTILFCLPLGIVGVYYSMKVDPLYLQGKYEEAQAMAKKSMNWSIAGCITGIVLAVIYAILSIFLMPIIGAYLQYAIMSLCAT